VLKLWKKNIGVELAIGEFFFAIILRGWGAIGTGGQIFLPFFKKKTRNSKHF
jgi:hypothetical protein